MTRHGDPRATPPRAHDLLADRALHGLDDADARELRALGADGDDSYDLAAAAVDLATLSIEPMPAAIAERILAARQPRTLAGWVMPATMNPPGVAPPGITPPGITPPGITPSGITPPGITPPGITPPGITPPGITPPGITSHGITPAGITPPGITPPGIASPGITPPGITPHGITPHGITPPGITPPGITPPGITPHGITPHGITPHGIARSGITPAAGLRMPSGGTTPPRSASPTSPARRRGRSVAVSFATAASLVLIVGVSWWLLRGRVAPTAVSARAELLASVADAATLAWHPKEASAASGDVVWSASAQRGFMRFVGLPPNDPTKTQYQLWIFDRQRDQAFPVDGGVFDVTSTGEVIIPITAKLRVDDATLFAVTVERPGGVVVSRREHIAVIAAPG